MSMRTYQEGEKRSSTQALSLAELRGPLRRVTESEIGRIDPMYIVEKDQMKLVWVCAAGSGPDLQDAPTLTQSNPSSNGSLSKDTPPTVFQAGSTPRETTSGIAKPWSRRSSLAHRPVGPGKHSHGNVGK